MEVARDVLLRGERTPVAIAGVSINPLGEVVSSAAGVEPEHVGPMIEAMQRLIERMRAFADKGVQAVATWAMLFGADIVLEPAIAAALDVAASTAQL